MKKNQPYVHIACILLSSLWLQHSINPMHEFNSHKCTSTPCPQGWCGRVWQGTSSRRDCESSQWCPVHHDCPRCQLEWRAATQCGKRQKVSKFSRVGVAIVIQGAKRRRVHARSSGCEPGGACVSFPKNLRALHLPPLSPYPKRTSAEHRILLLAP